MNRMRNELDVLKLELEEDMDSLRHSYEPGWSTRCKGCGQPFAWNERRVHVMLDPSTDAWVCVRCAGEDPVEDDLEYEEDGVPWTF